MEFVLAFHQPAKAQTDAASDQQASLAWKQYMGAMAAAGVMRSGAQLDSQNSRIVRLQNGERQVQYGSSSVQDALIAGYVVIDVASLEEALHWTARSPSSSDGLTEVIPVLPNARPKPLAFSFL